jgi:hypothetical protein
MKNECGNNSPVCEKQVFSSAQNRQLFDGDEKSLEKSSNDGGEVDSRSLRRELVVEQEILPEGTQGLCSGPFSEIIRNDMVILDEDELAAFKRITKQVSENIDWVGRVLQSQHRPSIQMGPGKSYEVHQPQRILELTHFVI